MRIVALGGAGGMGRAGLRVVASEVPTAEFVVTDLNVDAATELARELASLGHTASAEQVDVSDRTDLARVLRGADLVMNTVGPFSRFGVPVLEAAIEAGCRYVDLCDDGEPTLAMLSLDDKARDAGVAAVVGLGASPGFMNLLARTAAEGLDRVDDVIVGWTLNNVHRNFDMLRASFGSQVPGGNAALEHLLDQMSFSVPGYAGGAPTHWRTRDQVTIDIPGLGRGTGYVVGHPEPVTLPLTLSVHGSALAVVLHELGSSSAPGRDRTGHRSWRPRLGFRCRQAAVHPGQRRGSSERARLSEWRDPADLSRAPHGHARRGTCPPLPGL